MTNLSHINVVILAAGQGTRMQSSLPKVLHPLAGLPLVQHVINTSKELKPREINVVYGHGGEQVKNTINDEKINWVLQKEQLGTGHAVDQVSNNINNDEIVLILYGDVPLIHIDTLADLLNQATDGISLLTVHLENPQGYGRIVRDKVGQVLNITEEKDATDEIKKIHEVNTGILAVKGSLLKNWLSQLDNNNAQKEYYLTDVIAMAVDDNFTVHTTQPDNEFEVMGVNNRIQLAALERYYQNEQAIKLMAGGITLVDPSRIDVRGNITHGQDIFIDINAVFEGEVSIGNNVTIGANCVIKDSTINDGVEILPMSILDNAVVGVGSKVGPFARLRPGAELSQDTRIGNFVEIKKSFINTGSKVNHLTYIGDSIVGKNVNIGAGTITCNYDGANKHQTIIEDDVFIGSATQLVAPVKIGKNATIGAGSTITTDVDKDNLAITRVKQKSIQGWKRPVKTKKDN
ncbi:MAG: bifunctional UDP-N-acetylglucosamine diphosphorylase/glucosamine-1-phosphate N-acetyltransferase GlmU [Gammaproteobacteria bacterium]|nr:bifunctional UDP-N-acetylglucosamine diphosphorylase/glucosamine-1-phosphate N-acetyltransferase GlmU [Gammaproteobacteria bacterium]MDH5660238.1 bifunctional UDP-N-acetylglucosamine diphosphorylase/glucosamine-1-phosphate N-acetyltransferase GlmU [Gammaproteobacteria bacterium]